MPPACTPIASNARAEDGQMTESDITEREQAELQKTRCVTGD